MLHISYCEDWGVGGVGEEVFNRCRCKDVSDPFESDFGDLAIPCFSPRLFPFLLFPSCSCVVRLGVWVC